MAAELPVIDPVDFAAALIRCPSVTPADAGALDLLSETLADLGFTCHRLPFEEQGTARVDNLYARLGEMGPNFCFAGHTDVVPAGDEEAWSSAPFDPTLRDGHLIGRGAADMKGSIAAFVAAVARFVALHGAPDGSISLLITGDEEGPAINGTRKMLAWLNEHDERIDHCLVGEPTNPDALGDMIKIGRRGSINFVLTVRGTQGHVAYPHLAANPLPALARLADRLSALSLDEGNEHFQPSNLELTSLDTGNTATNVIPGEATARFNIRFNDMQTPESLIATIRKTCDAAIAEFADCSYDVSYEHTGDSFVTTPGAFTDILVNAVAAVTGKTPELSTSGGTSDARFIKDVCPVAEFGLISQTMHKVDERARVSDIERLSEIYQAVLEGYFRG